MRIRLSEKHGVNPSVSVCFYCGEDKNELVLPGRLPRDAEAPRRAVWSMEPCDQCKEWMAQGVVLISTRDGEAGGNDPYRTGQLCVIKDEALKRIVQPKELLDDILRRRFCFIEDQTWDAIGLPRIRHA